MALEYGAIWQVLGIAPTEDSTEIRRAYTKRLRAVHPEDDPKGFNELRLAYEAAAEGARLSGLRAIEENLQTTTARPVAARIFQQPAAPPPGRPPSVDSLTIDQMLDELTLDERREPELEHLRQELAQSLRTLCTPEERIAALRRVFGSEAMRSSRLYAETEIWVALLLRGHFPETEALLEPSITFYGWDEPGDGRHSPYRDRVLQRRDAITLRDTIGVPGHRLHKAYLALERPFLDSYAVRYGLTFGLHRRVSELMKTVDRNPEFEGLLDRGAVAWWRRHLRGPGRGPALFLGALVIPAGIAKLATSSDYSDYDGTTFLIIWFVMLGVYLLLVVALVAVSRCLRAGTASSGSWIEDLGEAAP